MRYCFKIMLLFLVPAFTNAQFEFSTITKQQIDSVHAVIEQTDNDSLRLKLYQYLVYYYLEANRDSAIYFYNQQLTIAKKINQPIWEGWAHSMISYELLRLGNYPKALQAANKALDIASEEANEKNFIPKPLIGGFSDAHTNRIALLATVYQRFAQLYAYTGEIDKSIANYRKAIRILETTDVIFGLSLYYSGMGSEYIRAGKPDSALRFEQMAMSYAYESGNKRWLGNIHQDIGQIYLQNKKYDSSLSYFQQSAKVSREQKNLAIEGSAYGWLTEFFLVTLQPDSALVYGNKALNIFQELSDQKSKVKIYASIYSAYQMKGYKDSAFAYLQLSKNLGDSIALVEKAQTNRYQNLNFEEQLRLENVEKEKIQLQAKVRTYALLAGIGVFMLIAFLLYRNNRNRKKTNTILQYQKEELQSTLNELKSTQSQLIQSEKMASLGELTAGIAHEIQNPLNFVNNFSDVNKELVDDLKNELATGNQQTAIEIADDIKNNEEKINHHGKRADAIVKGMLQHTRTRSGQKEPTDINALCDEYLRLAYHGLKAKDKSFGAKYETQFDSTINKINVVPQDIGRVLLNLINNAFYAVNEKGKLNISGYDPMVVVGTRRIEDKVEVKVKDNGNGIPDSIKEKIFQPFFTTKPTGQGTGLGLSLSYDIVKAHGGEIKIETSENKGSEFIIQLPVKM